eukprot:860862_1
MVDYTRDCYCDDGYNGNDCSVLETDTSAYVGWTEWVTKNQGGSPATQVAILAGYASIIRSLIAQEQGGYGLVNIGLSVSNDYETWTTRNFNGIRREIFINSQIIGMEVREQPGYGIINFRAILPDGSYSEWITDNQRGYSLSVETATVIAIQGREQG